jgi:hypothetical protein
MPLPTFIIAGERRCGTTSLYRWISSHPGVYLHHRTDLNYFIEEEIVGSREWRDGEADAERWEQTHSVEQFSELFPEAEGKAAIGYKGADLLFWRPAHARMARYVPDAKFIITLRNPVDRAWSHYWNEVGKGREKLGFEEAIAAEKERARSSAYARNHLSYIARGFYKKSLEAFFEHFSPSRVLIITLEQSRKRPEKTMNEIYNFLGVDSAQGLDLAGTQHNENWTMVPRPWAELPVIKPLQGMYLTVTERLIVSMTKDTVKRRKARKYAQVIFRKPAGGIAMPGKIRSDLLNIYAPHVRALELMLGRRFPEWRQ